MCQIDAAQSIYARWHTQHNDRKSFKTIISNIHEFMFRLRKRLDPAIRDCHACHSDGQVMMTTNPHHQLRCSHPEVTALGTFFSPLHPIPSAPPPHAPSGTPSQQHLLRRTSMDSASRGHHEIDCAFLDTRSTVNLQYIYILNDATYQQINLHLVTGWLDF